MEQPTQPAGTLCHPVTPVQSPGCSGHTFNIFGCGHDPKIEFKLDRLLAMTEKLMSDLDQAASDIAAIKSEEAVLEAFLKSALDQKATIDTLNAQIAAMTAADAAQAAQISALAATAADAKAGQDALVALIPAAPAPDAPPA